MAWKGQDPKNLPGTCKDLSRIPANQRKFLLPRGRASRSSPLPRARVACWLEEKIGAALQSMYEKNLLALIASELTGAERTS